MEVTDPPGAVYYLNPMSYIVLGILGYFLRRLCLALQNELCLVKSFSFHVSLRKVLQTLGLQ